MLQSAKSELTDLQVRDEEAEEGLVHAPVCQKWAHWSPAIVIPVLIADCKAGANIIFRSWSRN